MSLYAAIMAVLALQAVICLFMLIRNSWVSKARMTLIGRPDFWDLPSYDAMMFKFWIWDVAKFLPEQRIDEPQLGERI